jgi:catechol 2,3-dioxygenase-like lactoylglutathione lyase family enzyme
MKVDGLHYVTAITTDIDANLEFYGRLLGLRLVWQGVNADDREMRHIAYGDQRGSPVSIRRGSCSSPRTTSADRWC